MLKVSMILTLAFGVVAPSVVALDLSKIERTIRKEPAYKSKPKYCLLVFGPEAKTRIWLVMDGDVLYVDKNGNGDLTEEGERITAKEGLFEAGDIIDVDGKTKYSQLKVRKLDGEMTVETRGQFGEYTFLDEWADSPQDAPLRHFDGRLSIYLFDANECNLIRGEKRTDIQVYIGTVYPKGAWVYVDNRKGVPDDVHPMAEVTFPSKTTNSKPIKIKVPLTQRC